MQRRTRVVVIHTVLIAVLGLTLPVLGQAPPPSPASTVVARVEGRPITQADYDRVAIPYFARLRAQLGGTISEDIQKFANWSALNELIRRELLIIEAQRRGLSVSEAETDRVLQSDPLFQTNGQFDRAKFLQFKISPNSNYLNILPKLRELAGADKLDSLLRAEFRPSSRAVRAEWSKRNARVQFSFLAMTGRDVSLEPEATAAERAAYFANNPELFERKPRARFRYVRLALPAPGDSTFVEQRDAGLERGRAIADSLRAGHPFDSLAVLLGGALDTGLFDLPPVAIPGLGRVEDLNAELSEAIENDTGGPLVVGPVATPSGVVIGLVAERQARELPPMMEVLPDVKRRADADKRQRVDEQQKRAFFESHRDQYRAPRATVVRASLSDLGFRVRRPSSATVRRWYRDNGRTLFSGLHPRAELPELSDSLTAAITRRMMDDEQRERAHKQLERLAKDWGRGRDLAKLARSAKAVVETVTVVHDTGGDAIFSDSYLDSILTQPGSAREGEVQGPRSFGRWAVVWRVEALDLDHVPPFDTLRARIEDAFRRDRQASDEAAARVYFEQRRSNYTTKLRWIIDYIAFQIPPTDSITLSEVELRAHYENNRNAYTEEEQVRARHILISSDPTRTPGGEAAARARIDSLAVALAGGADFSELARQFSQDPGSGSRGGDLGFFGRGRMVQAFSDTSFALPIGRVSQPVKTQFGYHLILVDEHTPAGPRPFPEVRQEVERQLKQSRADTLTYLKAQENRAKIRRGVVVAAVAAPFGGVVTSTPFGQSEPVPGLGLVQGLDEDIGSLVVGQWAERVYRVGNAYVLVRLKQRLEPGLAGFDEVKFVVVQDMKNAKRDSLLRKRVADIQRRLDGGAAIDSVAALYGGLKNSGLLARNGAFVPYLGNEPRVVARAFDLDVGEVSDSIKTAQGYAWIRVDEKAAVGGATFQRDREGLVQEMLLEKYNDWIERKKKTVRLQIFRDDLKEPPPLQRTVTVGG